MEEPSVGGPGERRAREMANIPLLGKRFSPEEIEAKVRELLDGGAPQTRRTQ